VSLAFGREFDALRGHPAQLIASQKMRRVLLPVGNIAIASVVGVVLPFGWERAYYYVVSHFFVPVTTAHYKAVHYRDGDPIRDMLVFNAVFASIVGLTIPFLVAFVLKLRWYVLAPILIGFAWLVVWEFPAQGRLGIVWMLSGLAPYCFAVATLIGSYLGELSRKKWLAARASMVRS
jgi:hypothetical protein